MITAAPPEMAASSVERSSFCPSRTIFASFSLCLSHVMPCSCGSIISGQRAQLVAIAPFSTETRSVGRFCPAHVARSASVVRMSSGSQSGDMGTPPHLAAGASPFRYGTYVDARSELRKRFEKQPE